MARLYLAQGKVWRSEEVRDQCRNKDTVSVRYGDPFCGGGAVPVGVVVTRLLCWCRTNVLSVIVSDKGQ